MDIRYMRNVPALSETECALLQTKKVAVIGCGGLGGYLIELLSRVGVGGIRVVDGDVFEASNLNRQLLSEEGLLGSSKAEAAAARIGTVNSGVAVEAASVFLTEDNAGELIAGCDAVLDALDDIPARRALAQACADVGIPYIYGAISGWVAQAALCLPGDDLIGKLYPEEAVTRNKSVLSFTPALCASVQAALCIKVLIGRPVEHGVLCYYDLLHQESEIIPMI